MEDNNDWNDESRNELREALRSIILGEIRLSKSSHEDILNTCREVHIEDECPEDEWDAFSHYAADQIERSAKQHILEQSSWPKQTDCDRLDLVEEDLRNNGILLWQVSPCCDTCSGAELPDRIDDLDQRHPGFRERVRGYGFFIEQNMPEMLSENRGCSKFCVTTSELTRFACWPLSLNRASAQSTQRLKFKEVEFTGPGIFPIGPRSE